MAAAVGFADQAHLARHFTRIVGITPGEYAKQIRRSVFAMRPAPRSRSISFKS
ncbi:hypothetical protein [Hydrocarboniphaga sp.]|uniref:hypothetical protein n=1 Tax=Hydrocarboniphaga sp. TaxID=2033016 RepID=UPI00262C0FD4|nr:hypothetical protein [Hydrocarboniphaga sp.]